MRSGEKEQDDTASKEFTKLEIAGSNDNDNEAGASSLKDLLRNLPSSEICHGCQQMVEGDNIKRCSRCKCVTYCSRECQVKHWKTHKKTCRPSDTDFTMAWSKSQRKLTESLFQLTDQKVFARIPGGNAIAIEAAKFESEGRGELISISSIAKEKFEKHGEGILVLDFRNTVVMDMVSDSLVGCLQGSPTRYPVLPHTSYVLWPLTRNKKGKAVTKMFLSTFTKLGPNLQDTMQQIAAGGQEMFALCISTIGNGDGGSLAVNLYPHKPEEVRIGGKPLNKISQPSPKLSNVGHAMQLVERLVKDPSFEQCRRAMGKLQRGRPGMLWLRNIFTKGPIFRKRKELDKVTPETLLHALKLQLKEREPCKDDDLETGFAAIFLAIEKGNEFFWDNHYFQKFFLGAITRGPQGIKDPNKLEGCFVINAEEERKESARGIQFSFSLK